MDVTSPVLQAKRWALGLIVCLLPVLGACSEVTTEHFLSAPNSTSADKGLSGQWCLAEDDQTSLLWIREPENGLFESRFMILDSLTETGTDPDISPMDFSFHTSRVGDHSYANITAMNWVPDDEDAEESERSIGRWIFRYRLGEVDTLEIRVMDAAKAKQLVEKGRLRGQVFDRQYDTEVRLSNNAEALRAFLANNPPDAIFSDDAIGPFRRMTLSTAE